MTGYRARFTPEAAALVRRLHPEVRRVVHEGVESLVGNPLLGKALVRELSGFRSLRVKGYRIIYTINDDARTVDVYYVGRRRDVYELFHDRLIGK
jgi:mRNA interferase RelE/StbE